MRKDKKGNKLTAEGWLSMDEIEMEFMEFPSTTYLPLVVMQVGRIE